MNLEGKTALVTGGSRGIGRAICLALACAGADVAVCFSRHADTQAGRPEAAEKLAGDIRAMNRSCWLLDCDLAVETQVRAMVERVVQLAARLDILVCNAGICPMHDFLTMPLELFDRVHDVNLRGHFICCQEAARVMIARGGGGRIIAITSTSAMRGGAEQAHYCPTKSGLHSLIQCLAIILGPHGITCNSVAPGEVATDMTRAIPDHQRTWERLSSVLPLGRVGVPEDVGGLVALLASDAAAYITGQQICVDGGASVLDP